MKKLLLPLLLVFFSTSTSFASHVASGDIIYEYIGTPTDPYKYKVSLILVRDSRGIPMPTSPKINYSSSCFGSGELTLLMEAGSGVGFSTFAGMPDDPYNCIDTTTFDPDIYEYFVFSAAVNLPGACADWTFSYNVCCRNSSYTNFMGTLSTNFYIEALLNNTYSPDNSSPEFTSPPGKAFCVNPPTPFLWHHSAVEADGDSLFYSFATPSDGAIDLQFAPGYSVYQPIIANSPSSIDQETGVIILDPAKVEEVVIKVKVEEFRLNTTTGQYFKIGEISRENIVTIGYACNSTATDWHITTKLDSMSSTPVSVQCGDSTFSIYTQEFYDFNTLSPDGSDFVLYRNNFLIPIISAKANTTSNFKRIDLELHDTVSFNDTLYLVSVIGNDGNTLRNECGIELPKGDSIPIVFKGCSGLDIYDQPKLETRIFPNPAQEVITIEFADYRYDRAIKLLDPSGRVIHKITPENGSFSHNISIADLSPGIYFVQIEQDNVTKVKRFVKQ